MAAKKVLGVFALASLLMWVFPIGVLQVFNHDLISGLENMSPQSKTLWSGGLAVLSVNFVIAIYIFLALREPPVAVTPHPDPVFARRAKITLGELVGSQARSEAAETSSRPDAAEKSSRPDAAEKSRKSD